MKISREKFIIYSIVEEGLMSSESIGEGRMIPALVIDINGNKNIEDLIKIHKSITTGDVIMTWRFLQKKSIYFENAVYKANGNCIWN